MSSTKMNNIEGEFLPNLCTAQAVLLLVLAAELIALLLTLNASSLPHLRWDLLAMYSAITQWVSLASALAICRLRPWLKQWPPVKAGVVCYATVLGITLMLSLAGQFVLTLFGSHEGNLSIDVWQLINNMITCTIISGIALRYLYLQQQLRNQQRAELQARIQALQSRIRPHFLFNSMNSIASLIGSDPDKAEHLVEDLSELFRASLAEPTLIPIEREIELCRRYLEIEQLRLGRRLTIDWQIGTFTQALKIPSLMLQPLVENAIFHGIEPMRHGGTVGIKISQAKNQLMIAITNPYPLIKKPTTQTGSHSKHNRMALDNIRHRLRVHYGNNARLSSSEENGIFTTYIFCPLAN